MCDKVNEFNIKNVKVILENVECSRLASMSVDAI